MSERDVVRFSSEIIRYYYFNKQNFLFPNEISLLQKYCQYESAYFNLRPQFGIYHVQGLSKEETDILIKYYNNKLIELENSIEMRNFFCRIKEKEFIMSYGGGDDVKSVRETQDFSQIEEYIKKAEEIIKEKTNVNLSPPRYETTVTPKNIEKKAISKIIEQKQEERKQELIRQEEKRELSSCLLQFFCYIIAPFLLIGLFAFVAVYLF